MSEFPETAVEPDAGPDAGQDAERVLPTSLFDPDRHDDLFALSARLQRLTRPLHGRSDVIVRLRSALFHDPEHIEETAPPEHKAPGHFNIGAAELVIVLDSVIDFDVEGEAGYPSLADLSSAAGFLKSHPVMMGVTAHELAHARWSLNSPLVDGFAFMSPAERNLPQNMPVKMRRILEVLAERQEDAAHFLDDLDADVSTPAGRAARTKALKVASTVLGLTDSLEEPRIERLIQDGGPGMVFSKPWRLAAKAAAGKLVMDGFAQIADGRDVDVMAAARALAIVYGRVVSGIFDAEDEMVQAIVTKCTTTIDEAVLPILAARGETPGPDDELPGEAVCRIVRRATFIDEHEDPTPQIEAALDILDVLFPKPPEDEEPEPESQEGQGGGEGEKSDDESEGQNAPSGSGSGKGEKSEGESDGSGESDEESEGDDESDESDESGEGSGSEEESQDEPGEGPGSFMESLAEAAAEMVESSMSAAQEAIEVAYPQPTAEKPKGKPTHGSVLFADPRAPQLDEERPPNVEDHLLYRSVREWLERSMSPTVTEHARQGWMPQGDAEFDVDQYVFDELAGNVGEERGEWRRREWAVKPAPAMKIAVMLDCSGSMNEHTEAAASVAWAVQTAASDIPGAEVCSVAYGERVTLTLTPGRVPPRTLNIMEAGGGSENWVAARQMVDEYLRLDEAILDDLADPSGESRSNALIVIVSDLMYGYPAKPEKGLPVSAAQGVIDDINRWHDAGFRTVIVGPVSHRQIAGTYQVQGTLAAGERDYYPGYIVHWNRPGEIPEAADAERALMSPLMDSITGTTPRDMAKEFDRL